MPFAWNAQVLRLTLFLSAAIEGSGLWQKLTSESPEVDEHRPREGARRQAGPVQDALLTLQVVSLPGVPGRLDWLLSPQLPQADPAAHLGTAVEAVKMFDDLIIPWLGSDTDIAAVRIAFGLQAQLPVPDREAAYTALAELVPSVSYDPVRTREVLYSVNRPQTSRAIPGLELNRITKWASIQRALLMLAAPASGTVVLNKQEPLYFATCECDHNTPDGNAQAFKQDQLVPIYSELRDLALENLERGETP